MKLFNRIKNFASNMIKSFVNNIFKVLTTISIVVFSLFSHAEDSFYIVNDKKTDSKVEALKTLINDPNAQVFKCDAQELTKKATLKKK